jgi:hypothetical protein
LATSAAVSGIAGHCEGLPLALRVVRERLSAASIADAERLAVQLGRDRRSRLAALDLGEASEEASVWSALRWSYDALPPDAAAAFRELPLCLVPTFDLHCMAVLLDADVDSTRRLLDGLVSANLLDPAGSDYYRVHDLVVTFAAECLQTEADQHEVSAGRVRLLRYLCATAEVASHADERPIRIPWPPELTPPQSGESSRFVDQAAATEWVIANADLLAAAVLDAASNGPPAYAWLLAERGWRTFWWAADVGRFEPALRAGYSAAIVQNSTLAAIIMSRLMGITYGRRGELDEAELAFSRAVDLSARAGASLRKPSTCRTWRRSGRCEANWSGLLKPRRAPSKWQNPRSIGSRS